MGHLGGLLDLSQPPLSVCVSTQDLCRELALQGAGEGTVVRAREQASGRGRKGRTWESARDLGLWMSFILRPIIETAHWPSLTALVALALAEALEDLAPPEWRAGIKWPNDLFGRRGKLAGILAETAGSAIIVGLGLNLAHRDSDFAPGLRGRASSLGLEGFDPAIDAEAAVQGFNRRLTPAYAAFQQGDRDTLQRGLKARFYLRGARVRIECGARILDGIACDVGAGGELVCEVDGVLHHVISGEVVKYELPTG